MQSTGNSGGEGARTHVQGIKADFNVSTLLTNLVFANSGVASILTLLHAYQLHQREQGFLKGHGGDRACYSWPGDLLVVGIVANYAAVAADTFSSELGILSKSHPRLITSWNLRRVPPGTNGGVTVWGLVSGLLGSLIIVTASMALIPFCSPKSSITGLRDASGWDFNQRQRFTYTMTLWGALGSVLDSLLGGWLQQSVVDTRTGRIVEGAGGKRVLVNSMHNKKQAEIKAALLHGEGKGGIEIQPQAIGEDLDNRTDGLDKYDAKRTFRKPSFGDEKPTRKVESGMALLDNNDVNFVMALTMSLGAMGVASWFWEVPLSSILPM
jgi:uncharacterized membrane protein